MHGAVAIGVSIAQHKIDDITREGNIRRRVIFDNVGAGANSIGRGDGIEIANQQIGPALHLPCDIAQPLSPPCGVRCPAGRARQRDASRTGITARPATVSLSPASASALRQADTPATVPPACDSATRYETRCCPHRRSGAYPVPAPVAPRWRGYLPPPAPAHQDFAL